jgi:hypothetical protein
MSFSYIKNVFPDFNYSSVYDDKLYNNLNTTKTPKVIERDSDIHNNYGRFDPTMNPINRPSTDYTLESNKIIEPFTLQQSQQQSQTQQTTTTKPQQLSSTSTIVNNNQVFSNLPLVNNNIPSYTNIDFTKDLNVDNIYDYKAAQISPPPSTPSHVKSFKEAHDLTQGFPYVNEQKAALPGYRTIELMTNTNNIQHEQYIQHILSCKSCKEVVMTQLQLENDKLYKEEMMELVSYVILALFILLLLDTLAK